MFGDEGAVSTVQLVDLATGVCTPQPALLHPRNQSAAARMPDGCIVCTGGIGVDAVGVDVVQSTTEMWGPPVQGAMDAVWTWRAPPIDECRVNRLLHMRDERRPLCCSRL